MKITSPRPGKLPTFLPVVSCPFFLFLFLLIVPLVSSAQEKPKPDYVLKFATIAPENSVWGDVINQAAREVEQETGNRVKMVWYFGGVMGDEPDVIRKIKLDQIQGSALLSVGLSKLAPEVLVFSLPYMFENYQEIDCVFERSWPLVEKVFDARGFVTFGRADIGFSVLFSKDNLRNAEDYRKTKLWTWAGLEVDKASAHIFNADNLVPLTLAEVLPGLKSGMVDTVYATYYTSIALQWNTQIRFMSNLDQGKTTYAPAMMVIKKDSFNALPPELRRIVRDAFARPLPALRERLRLDEAASMKKLLEKGVKFMETDPRYLEEIKARARDIYRDWENVYFPNWFLQGILTARNQCRAESK